ncbi:MAG: zinc ribbon domain-containing protein [Acidobacteria bacterium]|nr:zinc ribbon domain-containing protein [Acidobacteriota bacterium]
MADYCTCGAELPPDARFCHKCGKPQRDEPLFAPEPVAVPAELPIAAIPAAAAPPSTDVTFHNRPALLSALTAAVIGLVLMMLLFLPAVVRLAAPFIAGLLSVLIYRRRTQHPVNLKNGLRLGWITGMLAFAISVVIFTLSVVFLVSDPQAVGMLKDRMQGMASPAELDEMIQMLRTPAGILAWLFSTFFTLTGLPMLGGALGSAFLGKRPEA